jgi:hypothetical protein
LVLAILDYCCDFHHCKNNCCFICSFFSCIESSSVSIQKASSTTYGGSEFHYLCGNGIGSILNMIRFIKEKACNHDRMFKWPALVRHKIFELKRKSEKIIISL